MYLNKGQVHFVQHQVTLIWQALNQATCIMLYMALNEAANARYLSTLLIAAFSNECLGDRRAECHGCAVFSLQLSGVHCGV